MREEKLQRLPLHHIDTSVVLEPTNTDQGRCCARYLNLVGYKFRGKFSIPMLGELLLYIFRILDNYKRYEILDEIIKIMRGRSIGIFGARSTEGAFLETARTLASLGPLDRLLLSCAVSDSAVAFVTIDARILRFKELIRQSFNLDVKHPRELI